MPRSRAGSFCALLVALALCASHARAQESAPSTECSSERFIVLTEDGLDPALFAEVRTDLATELAHRGIDVCAPDATTREPAALATLSSTDSTVVVELNDRLTHKRVGRDLTLSRLPANGRALAIAIAIDELLRASWAELTLRREEPGEASEPSVPRTSHFFDRRVVNARGRYESRPAQLTLAPEFGYLHSSKRFDAFSLGVRFTVRPWQRGWFAVSAAGLASLKAHGPLGDAFASGARGTLTAGLCSRDRQRVFACAGARAEADFLALRGLAPQMAQSQTHYAGTVLLTGVALLGFPLTPRRMLFGEFAVGGALVGAEANDGQRTLMGVTGVVLAANLGLELEL